MMTDNDSIVHFDTLQSDNFTNSSPQDVTPTPYRQRIVNFFNPPGVVT